MEETVLLTLGNNALCDPDQVIETKPMSFDDWDELGVRVSNHELDVINVRASKSILSQHSTYFRSLFNNFSEAKCGEVTVSWDLKFLCMFLQYIFTNHLVIYPSNFCILLEGAVFFGAEGLISDCTSWATSEMHPEINTVNYELLQHIPCIYSTSIDLGFCSMANLCVQFLSIHFEELMTSKVFLELPHALLCACIDHDLLTVSSEKRLCEAILKWGSTQQPKECIDDLFSRVRMGLLPIDFVTENFGPELAKELKTSILSIRLSKYLKVVDLTCCSQITDQILLKSVATEHITLLNSVATEHITDFLKAMVGGHKRQSAVSSALEELSLEKCWRVNKECLVSWIETTCRSLRILNLRHCPQLPVALLFPLFSVCPLIETADFSMNMTTLKEIEHTTVQRVSGSSFHGGGSHLLNLSSFSFLVFLSLEGRIGISDFELGLIATTCSNISSININGCRSLSDSGISSFLEINSNLKTLRAACTDFGPKSLKSLLPASETLETLDLDNCMGLSDENLRHLLSLMKASNIFL